MPNCHDFYFWFLLLLLRQTDKPIPLGLSCGETRNIFAPVHCITFKSYACIQNESWCWIGRNNVFLNCILMFHFKWFHVTGCYSQAIASGDCISPNPKHCPLTSALGFKLDAIPWQITYLGIKIFISCFSVLKIGPSQCPVTNWLMWEPETTEY